MKQLICLSPLGWCETPSRTQQLLSRMRDTKILYFSPKGDDIHPSGQRVRPNITVYTLPNTLLPPSITHPTLMKADWGRLGRYISKIANKHRFFSPMLWATSPKHIHLLPHIDYNGLIYDCDQEWDDLPIEWEGQLARLSDFIFVASEGLRERLSPCNHNIAVIPNGVNFPLFSSCTSTTTAVPTFGWVGRISDDLDFSPLLCAARAHPDWKFYLIGDVDGRENTKLPALRHLPNVRLHPACPLAEVPQYLALCNVLMDFARTNSAGNDIVPRRIYEYLSTGLPIVSMLLPDQVELFPDVIYGAHDPVEFLNMCESALHEPAGYLQARRRHHGEEASWVCRIAEINQILNTTGFL